MKKLQNSLKNKIKDGKIFKLSDDDRRKVYRELYSDLNYSWRQIADLCGTYGNKVKRDANKLGIESKTKSEAQSAALESGRHKHPTKGVGHSEESKIKISESVAESWEHMPTQKRLERKIDAKARWNQKSEKEIEEFRKASLDAIRVTAREGSALEKYLLEGLISNGFRVEFHKEQWVERERLQIDLLIPDLNIAIEVDGPSHHEAIWGDDILRKNQARDHEKNGLLLRQGYVIIRIKQGKGSLSNKFKRDTLSKLVEQIKKISKKVPSLGNRCITLGE